MLGEERRCGSVDKFSAIVNLEWLDRGTKLGESIGMKVNEG